MFRHGVKQKRENMKVLKVDIEMSIEELEHELKANDQAIARYEKGIERCEEIKGHIQTAIDVMRGAEVVAFL